jgi:hypothetical protein
VDAPHFHHRDLEPSSSTARSPSFGKQAAPVVQYILTIFVQSCRALPAPRSLLAAPVSHPDHFCDGCCTSMGAASGIMTIFVLRVVRRFTRTSAHWPTWRTNCRLGHKNGQDARRPIG